jgi:hypothetical protein
MQSKPIRKLSKTLIFLFITFRSFAHESTLFLFNYQETDGASRDPQWIKIVKDKYERKIEGIDCIYYPAKNPKKLIIYFSYFGDKYMMWKWFWRDTEDWEDTSYLFLKDDLGTWYCGTYAIPLVDNYLNLIRHFIRDTGVAKEHIFTVGVSMGGYAAILYATLLELRGAIADNPQFDRETWQQHTKMIDPAVNWQDIQEILNQSKKVPIISLNFSAYILDYLNAYNYIETLKTKKTVLLVRNNFRTIHDASSMTKSFVEKEINYMDTLELLNS